MLKTISKILLMSVLIFALLWLIIPIVVIIAGSVIGAITIFFIAILIVIVSIVSGWKNVEIKMVEIFTDKDDELDD